MRLKRDTMNARTSMLRRSILPLAAAIAMLTLTACGGDDSGDQDDASAVRTAANGDVFNDADVEFATDMIPHHAQAVEMVVMADGRPLDPAVQQLATRIRDAQVPEVETMSDWLTAWGEEVPATSIDHTNGHDADATDDADGMGGMSSDMPGMMSADEMDALEASTGQEFQDMWLRMMMEHHAGAIDMAESEQDDGAFPDALQLAATIESGQQEEIATMKQLLEG